MFSPGGTRIVKGRELPEIIQDTKFQNPEDWELVGSGVSVVDGGLRFVDADSTRVAPLPEEKPDIGETCVYKIHIEQFVSGSECRCMFGGVEIWNQSQGAGVFRGEVVPVNETGLVFQALPGTYTVRYASVQALSRTTR